MLGLATALNSGSLKKKSVLTNKLSAELDGTGDYIDISSLSSDLDKAAGTISMWIRVQATASNESFFNCSSGTDTDNKIFLIYSTSGTKLQAGYKFSGTGIIASHTIANDDLTGLGWFHLAMTYNTSTPLIQLFLNGTRVAQRTTSLTTISEDVAIDRIRLGSNSTGNDTYHHGNIDEFIYIAGKDLTETEMLLLYNNGKPDDIGDLPSAIRNAIKCWLRFGEGSIDGSADQTSVIFDEKNSTLDSELVTANDFSQFSTYGTVDISNNIVTIAATSNSGIFGGLLTNGKFYKVIINVLSLGDTGHAQVVNDSGTVMYAITTTGEQTFYFKHVVAVANIIIRATSNMSMSFTSLSIKQVQGNPGFCVADATVGNSNVP